MPTKEEKQSSSGSSSSSSGGGTTTTSNSNGNSSSSSSSCSNEKHKYCLLCNRNDFTLNAFNATIEKDLRAIFNTEVIKTALSSVYCPLTILIFIHIVYANGYIILFQLCSLFRFFSRFFFLSNFCIHINFYLNISFNTYVSKAHTLLQFSAVNVSVLFFISFSLLLIRVQPVCCNCVHAVI